MKKCLDEQTPAKKNALPASRGRMYKAARAYRKAGLSFIPISADGTKQPAFELLPRVPRGPNGQLKRSWGVFRERQPTAEQIRDGFQNRFPAREYGLAILCGQASGNLEVIDIDDYAFVKPWGELVEEKCPGLLDRLVRVKTPRPGLHVYFRSPVIGGSTKLAQIASHQLGQKDWRPTTIIELKAEGACCVAPPSPPACHPANRPYKVIGGLDLTMIPMISQKEREMLFDAARALDTWGDPQTGMLRRQGGPRSRGRSAELLPGDDFNQRATWGEILEPYGWRKVGNDGLQTDYWCRPRKSSGTSASTNYQGCNLLYVFSSSAAPFEENTGYSKFAAYTLLRHDGDFEAAARELAGLGYGRPRSRRRHNTSRPFGGTAGWRRGRGKGLCKRRKPR